MQATEVHWYQIYWTREPGDIGHITWTDSPTLAAALVEKLHGQMVTASDAHWEGAK